MSCGVSVVGGAAGARERCLLFWISFIFRVPKSSRVPRKPVSHVGGRGPRVGAVNSYLGVTPRRDRDEAALPGML